MIKLFIDNMIQLDEVIINIKHKKIIKVKIQNLKKYGYQKGGNIKITSQQDLIFMETL